MDLSFPPFDRAAELVAWPGDLAALMVGVATRQGTSATASAQAGLPGRDEVPVAVAASFNPEVAALLARWAAAAKQGVNGPFTAAGQGIFNALGQNDEHEFKPGTGAPIEDQ